MTKNARAAHYKNFQKSMSTIIRISDIADLSGS